jgi:hypothetical protein
MALHKFKQVGDDVLRGMCAGEDADVIHACVWTLEPAAPARGKEKRLKYRIEF